MKKNISLLKLFAIFFKINAITFGGGYTIVPVIKDIFVNDLKLIKKDEMLNIVALAQSGPGAMTISTSLLTGYKLRGATGAIVALVASSLPCLLILSIISIFYQEFKSNLYIKAALQGISGVICAVLFITVFNMAKSSYKNYPVFTVIVVLLIFILGYIVGVTTAPLILLSALLGFNVFYVIDRGDNID